MVKLSFDDVTISAPWSTTKSTSYFENNNIKKKNTKVLNERPSVPELTFQWCFHWITNYSTVILSGKQTESGLKYCNSLNTALNKTHQHCIRKGRSKGHRLFSEKHNHIHVKSAVLTFQTRGFFFLSFRMLGQQLVDESLNIIGRGSVAMWNNICL